MAAGSGETVNISALPRMVRWYSPSHLISTGWRSVVSELFGQYADQRIMQATIDGFAPEVMPEGRRPLQLLRSAPARRRQHGLGRLRRRPGRRLRFHLRDGLADQRALARHRGRRQASRRQAARHGRRPGLSLSDAQGLPRALRISLHRRRFPRPRTASWRRLLFVLPGNHDWYDGLSSFDYMFCKARFGHAAENRIGGWLCPQHRSYFAIRLPHNWWIWGADIQLAQYLDAGQVLYFEGVAEAMKQHPTEAPKLILCTPEPTLELRQGRQPAGRGQSQPDHQDRRRCGRAHLRGDRRRPASLQPLRRQGRRRRASSRRAAAAPTSRRRTTCRTCAR